MKVLLVIYDNNSYIHYFPVGLGYIAAVLKKAGHSVSIYNQDKEHYSEEHLTRFLDENHFDIVGVSVVGGYYQYRKLLLISHAINGSSQRPFYIIGGHGPSPEPEYFLRKTKADAIVIGEGEETILELIDAIEKQKRFENIQGIAYRVDSKVFVNERRPLINDIDSIPWPAYELFPIDYYRLLREPHCTPSDFVMPVLSGRGCTFKCNFCYRMDEGYRMRSKEAVAEEIKFLHNTYRIRYIEFTDELLMSSKQRIQELCHYFLDNGLAFKWFCSGRLNYASPDILSLMKKAGCVFINYGIESVDNAVLRNMNKALTDKIIIKGIEATYAAGISPGLNIIWGNIGDNKETLQKSVEFLLKYDDGAQLRTIRPVTPYPGCPLYYHAIEKGLLKDVEDFYEKKHLNSDLLAVNFTDLNDNEFNEALLRANTVLIRNYFKNRMKEVVKDAKILYHRQNTTFRGFRQI